MGDYLISLYTLALAKTSPTEHHLVSADFPFSLPPQAEAEDEAEAHEQASSTVPPLECSPTLGLLEGNTNQWGWRVGVCGGRGPNFGGAMHQIKEGGKSEAMNCSENRKRQKTEDRRDRKRGQEDRWGRAS